SVLVARLEGCVRTEPAGLATALDADPSITGVVCLWEIGAEEEPPVAAQRVVIEGLAVVHALRGRGLARMAWVTTRAVSVESEDEVDVATAPIWGLGRTVMQEHPELSCALVDLAPGVESTDDLLRELSATDGEDQVAWRAGQRRAARLVRAPAIP